ncbi:MAG: hypothetical protein WD059_00340 [Balneolaceae bacterium]
MEAKKMNTDHERPTIRHTKRGSLYANPRDILTSKNAQKQLQVIRESDLLKKVRAHRKAK